MINKELGSVLHLKSCNLRKFLACELLPAAILSLGDCVINSVGVHTVQFKALVLGFGLVTTLLPRFGCMQCRKIYKWVDLYQ